MMTTITRDDWLKALNDVWTPPADDPSALTAREFAEREGIGWTTANHLMRKLTRLGRATKVTKSLQCADGRTLHVTAYKLLEADHATPDPRPRTGQRSDRWSRQSRARSRSRRRGRH